MSLTDNVFADMGVDMLWGDVVDPPPVRPPPAPVILPPQADAFEPTSIGESSVDAAAARASAAHAAPPPPQAPAASAPRASGLKRPRHAQDAGEVSEASAAVDDGARVAKAARCIRYDPLAAAAGVFEGDRAIAMAPTLEGDAAAAVSLIVATLREGQTGVVAAAVDVLGAPACLATLTAAVETEKAGGLMTADGARRRSPGGVFFELLKEVASKEQLKAIFAERQRAHTQAQNSKKRGGGGAGGGS